MKLFTKSRASAALKFPFQLIADQLREVEDQIKAEANSFDPAVEGYISYVLGTSGKRIRPALALLVGGACGVPTTDHQKLGIVLELIHLATLVHDDIMDGAALRRAQPTAAAKWGNSLSVLLGDCLFAHALELAASFDSTHISRKIARSSNEVCTGEILQTQRRFDLSMTIPDYFRIISMKTAALFSSAAELSAWLSGASAEVQENMRKYGDLLGTAYQIYDDCLDLTGNEEQAGKTLGTDLVKGKLTLPILYLLEESSEEQRSQLNTLILRQEPIDISIIAGIAGYAGAIRRSVATARGMLDEAREAVAILPENDHTTALNGITDYLDSLLENCKA
ncbi:MAG: polyprenyl synthetase family protein [Verrucomicrobiaceae bacterium]|nr:MAG: polyprenyl synthetase family protein [Verrucomicrobiaceae bacterium]